jgi:uncharacterized protein
MLTHIFIMLVALLASTLTFFSGFGLGTILLPAMALFFPVAVAIVLTGIVHFINGSFKVLLMRKHIHLPTLWRFGLLAIPAAFVGAWLLTKLEGQGQVIDFILAHRKFSTTPIKLTVGILMMSFALIEGIPKLKHISIDQKYLPIGGIISGFFGGLTGNQGAFRSMFLIRAKLSKEQFIATGSAFSFFVDLTRLSVYLKNISIIGLKINTTLLILASASALTGVVIGNRLLKKVDMKFIRYVVAVTIFVLGILITLGVI